MTWDTDWTLVDFDEPKRAGGVKASPVSTSKGICPKCKKKIGRGIHRHVKACKGNDNTGNA